MDFIKKNYEKVLLGFVLFGLVVGAVAMLLLVANEKEQLAQLSRVILAPQVQPLPPPDVGHPEAALARAAKPMRLTFSDNLHKLFNPVTWGRAPDGHLVKIDGANEPKKLEITKTTPLYTFVRFNSVLPFETGIRYVVETEQQAAAK